MWKTLRQLGASRVYAMTGVERTTYLAFGPRSELDNLGAIAADLRACRASADISVLGRRAPSAGSDVRR